MPDVIRMNSASVSPPSLSPIQLLCATLVATLFLLSAISLGGCSESSEQADTTDLTADRDGAVIVEEIRLALDSAGAEGTTIEDLQPEDQKIHIVFRLNQLGPDVTVRGVVTAIETTEGNNLLVLDQQKIIDEPIDEVDFAITLGQPWPTGSYQVDAYVDDQFSIGRKFEVK